MSRMVPLEIDKPYEHRNPGIWQKAFRFFTSKKFKHLLLPKIFYFFFELMFLSILIYLNLDWLTEDMKGVALLVTILLVAVGTIIMYLLTGCTDPGYVHSAVFQNHETTEFFEEEEEIEK